MEKNNIYIHLVLRQTLVTNFFKLMFDLIIELSRLFVLNSVFFFSNRLSNLLIVDQLNNNAGKTSAILLDTKYDNIRKEAINAGILLKETDEKIDEIINDGQLIKSHALDVRTNALKFYRNLIRSEKIRRFCQLMFILIICIILLIFLGKMFTRKTN